MFKSYLFPFDAIPKGSKIAIYGAGAVGGNYISQLTALDYCEIVCVVDKAHNDIGEIEGIKVLSPEYLSCDDCDYVVIAAKPEFAESIREDLQKLGVPEEKIVYRTIQAKIVDELADYVGYLEEHYYTLRYRQENKNFVYITEQPYEHHEDDTKLVAWYLPQFHRIAINEQYRGRGFTEWTNVTRNIPLFAGHNQPYLPFDLGFYDLTDVEVLKRQVELAKMYGIYGFAFHYYWFSGTKFMEKPLELFLAHKELDIKYCMHWCSEDWSALWEGEDGRLIIKQELKSGDDAGFMADIIPYMKDERYIKIDGKPLLQIYLTRFCEKERFAELMANFRNFAKKAGFPDLYIMLTTKNRVENNASWGIDAMVEFPDLSVMQKENQRRIKGYVNPHFEAKHQVYDAQTFLDSIKNNEYLEHFENLYRSVMVNYDNTSRAITTDRSALIVNATPSKYKEWLKYVLQLTNGKRRDEENYAFIFAWNEWAESACLEPDMFHGYAYLQATKEALEETRESGGGL
jgi:lipopolysaccharide biosynthesis protein